MAISTRSSQRACEGIAAAPASGKPLFMSLHYTAPHWPWEGPEDEAVSKHHHQPATPRWR